MGDVSTIVGGGTPDTQNPAHFGGDIAWLTPADLSGYTAKVVSNGSRNLSAQGLDNSGAQLMPAGSVLFSSRAPIGYVAIAANPISTNQGFKSFVLERELSPDFVYYFLLHAKPIATMLASGTTFLEISGKNAARIPIPIAPTNEQLRIAESLDELLSDLDAGVASLEGVRAKLKLYRASVLKAAVDGTLTAEWRAQHPKTEPASELLKRILIERRGRWEDDQVAKFKAKGLEPPKNWKGKYKEPRAPETTKLPSLPKGWCWASLDQLAWTSGYGTSQKCSEAAVGLAVLRIPNIVGGKVDLDNLKFAPPEYSELDSELVKIGDLLVVRTNGSRKLIGRGALVCSEISSKFSFASYLIRLRILPNPALLKWVSLLWDSYQVRHWIESRAATSAGQYNISLSILETLTVPIPPAEEQEVVVDAAEDQLSIVAHLESDLDAKLGAAQGLRQAVLRHAFSGKLVSQDPNDEPASELLKRISAERAARSQETANAKRSANKKVKAK